MNGTDQREHRTVTRALQQQINDLVAIVSALEAQQATIYGEAVEAMAAERTARFAMRDAQRRDFDKQVDCCQARWDVAQARWDVASETHKRIGDRHAEFVGRGFWSRLNWFLTGR